MKGTTLFWMLIPSLAGLAQTMEAPVFGEAERVVERLLYPETFDVVDWDGDGDFDVLAAGSGNNRLALFEGNEQGGYDWMQLLPENTMADDWNDFRAVDWNGDGLVDLVACEEGGLVWLERQADGLLSAPVLLRAGDNPIRMAIADLNTDGVLDVAYCDDGTNEAILMLGSSGGEVIELEVESLNGATAVALADWDGDGELDWIFSAYSSGRLYVRHGEGNAVFGAAELVADFGKLSAIGVLVDPNGGEDAFFLGVDDTYVFQWHPSTAQADTLGLLAKAQQFDFGDLNGDGLIDVAVAAQTSGECGVIFAAAGGGFDPEILEFEVHQATDVAIVTASGEQRLFTNSRTRGQVGYRTIQPADDSWEYTPLVEGIQYVRNMAAGDVNADGLDDVLVMVQGTNLYNGGPEYLYVCLALPDSGFDVSYVPTGTYFGYEVQLADYDGDSDLDAVVSDYNGDRVVGLRNDGAGVFALADTLIADINGCDDLALVDLDNDGDLDIVAAAWQGSDVLLALNDGQGIFGMPVEMENTGSRCEAVAVADFDGNGTQDVAACFENSGDVRVWLRTGSAESLEFNAPQLLELNSAQDLQAADADGDGDVDLIGVGYNEADVVVFGNSDGVFDSGSGLGMDGVNGALMLTASDADGDGVAEVIVSEYGGSRFRLFHSESSSTLELYQAGGPQNAVFGDFDGDGDQDVAMAFYSTGEIRWVELLAGLQPPPCYGSAELVSFLAHFGCSWSTDDPGECSTHDLNADGEVNVWDFLEWLTSAHLGCD